jgi:hypothetical protein
MVKRILFFDESKEVVSKKIIRKEDFEPLPEEFGKNLSTIEDARKWLTNPHNWHSSNLFVIKWDGLLCTVNERFGQRLIDEPNDIGLLNVAVIDQIRIKRYGKCDDESSSMEEQ